MTLLSCGMDSTIPPLILAVLMMILAVLMMILAVLMMILDQYTIHVHVYLHCSSHVAHM